MGGGGWVEETPQQMATVADDTHPTGMHSCSNNRCMIYLFHYLTSLFEYFLHRDISCSEKG